MDILVVSLSIPYMQYELVPSLYMLKKGNQPRIYVTLLP